MTESVLLSGMSIADFKRMMATLVEEVVEKKVAQVNHQPKQLKPYLTRQDVKTMLGVSIPTLIKWDKEGYLKSFQLGVRNVRYRNADVQAAMDNRMKMKIVA